MEPARERVSLAEAFARMPRQSFLPEGERTLSDSNVPLQIGHGQTNSQPSTVSDMLQLLDPRLGDHVLDVGSGSGWTTALLGILVGQRGYVIGIERHRQLVDNSRKSLSMFDFSNVEIVAAARGSLGLANRAPFDRILVSAEAESLPTELLEQLSTHGVMVIPVQGQMLKVVRTGPEIDAVTVTTHGRYRFVPLVRD